MPDQPAVRARGICKSFGDVIALDQVDLDIPAGRIHGLVGPNGAGKTTMLGLLLGLAAPDSGELSILGHPVRRSLARPDGVAGFIDGPGLYPSLTATQNLKALARLRGAPAERIGPVLDEVGLSDVAHDRVRGFSLGMRQRLGLAAALLTRPRLLVLDEPANGLDPAGTRQVHSVLSKLPAEGTSVVLSSHRMDELSALCNEVTILATGQVVFSGPISELAIETDDREYRLRTSDRARTRRFASELRQLDLRDDPAPGHDRDSLLVRASAPALNELVARLINVGVLVYELAPVVPPLEAAFLALTGGGTAAGDTAVSEVEAGQTGSARSASEHPAARADELDRKRSARSEVGAHR